MRGNLPIFFHYDYSATPQYGQIYYEINTAWNTTNFCRSHPQLLCLCFFSGFYCGIFVYACYLLPFLLVFFLIKMCLIFIITVACFFCFATNSSKSPTSRRSRPYRRPDSWRCSWLLNPQVANPAEVGVIDADRSRLRCYPCKMQALLSPAKNMSLSCMYIRFWNCAPKPCSRAKTLASRAQVIHHESGINLVIFTDLLWGVPGGSQEPLLRVTLSVILHENQSPSQPAR